MNATYTYKGKKYEIVDERNEFILSDFQYCESIGDWVTIQHRITNGKMFGWLKEINK